MEINRDKIAYLPGLLAHKLGIGKGTLMKHLRATGLIEKCWRTKYSWHIPYEVALQIASPEILAGPPPGRRKRSRLPNGGTRGVSAVEGVVTTHRTQTNLPHAFKGTKKNERQPEPDKPAILPDYRQVGKMLRAAGITLPDLIKYIEQQMQTGMQKVSPSSGGLSLHQMEESNEQNAFAPGKNNSAQRDEIPTSETSTSGSAGADIPNSRAQ